MIESFKLPTIIPETLTGSIVSFNDEYGNLPLKSCVSQITGYQEGSGIPSPSNVRNLVSFNSATLTENGNTYTFTFGQSIYQGSIDWKRGVVVGNVGIVNLGNLNWVYASSGQSIGFVRTDDVSPLNIKYKGNCICSSFEGVTTGSSAITDNQITIANSQAMPMIFIKSITLADLTTAQVKANLNGVMLAYELATPLEISLGGINLLTQEGQNNIYCDTGDTEVKWLHVN